MYSKALTVTQYLDELPADRRAAIKTLRTLLKKHLPKGLQETMCTGMISYVVPLKTYERGYLNDPSNPLPYAYLASQKNHMALYLLTAYIGAGSEAWIRDAFAKAGKKLDIGKSCIRFKSLDDLPLDVIAEAAGRVSIPDYIMAYEDARKASKARGKK